MKKQKLLTTLLIVTMLCLLFTSCSAKGDSMRFGVDKEAEIADKTFSEIIGAIQSKDASKIAGLFSPAIQKEQDMQQGAEDFLDFIQGDVVSHSSAADAGIGTDSSVEKGKKATQIQSSFSVKTTQGTYYIAVRECIADDFNSKNVGVVSIYIIDAKDWTAGYVYRGDGEWTLGINIQQS